MHSQTMATAKSRFTYATVLLCVALPMLALLLLGAAPATPEHVPTAANDWRVGNIVYLVKGTQIRVAQGFSVCYHTVVPEDNWPTMVINGPRYADGREWWDTSRQAAGAPTEGTGWVNRQQADSPSPAALEPGEYCPPGQPTPTPTQVRKDVCDALSIHLPGFIYSAQDWWAAQLLPIKIGVVVVSFILLFSISRWISRAGPILTTLVRAILWGVFLAGLADLTRSYWLNYWMQFMSDRKDFYCGLDPPLLLLISPLVIWGLILLFGAASRIISILVTILLGFFLLTLLTPERVSGIIDGILRLFGGGPKP
jgi:hypothetical protein